MCNIRQIFQLAGQKFSGWKRNPRIVMTFLLAFVLCLFLSDEVLTYSRRYETSLQILELFIWTYGDAASVMLSSLLLVLLFADMPFVNQETPYQLIRTKRSVWLAGQLVYVIAATILYNLFLVIVQSVFAAAFAFPGNVWSKTAALLGYGGASKGIVPVSVKTMEQVLPYECALQVFLLMLCYFLFILYAVSESFDWKCSRSDRSFCSEFVWFFIESEFISEIVSSAGKSVVSGKCPVRMAVAVESCHISDA